jgi:5'-3' exonuclease
MIMMNTCKELWEEELAKIYTNDNSNNGNKSSVLPLEIFEKYKYKVLVDGSWLLHKFYHASDLTFEGEKISNLYLYTREIALIRKALPGAAIIICLDDSKGNWRQKVFSNYKAHREHDPLVYKHLARIYETIAMINDVYFGFKEDLEGDDVIYSLAKEFSTTSEKIIIYANDNDIWQTLLLADNIEISWKLNYNRFDDSYNFDFEHIPTKCFDKYGWRLENHVFCKALRGDTADNIDGYKRTPTKVITFLADYYQHDKELFLECLHDSHLPKPEKTSQVKWIEKIEADPDKFFRNFELVKLKADKDIKIFKIRGNLSVLDDYPILELLFLYRSVVTREKIFIAVCCECLQTRRIFNKKLNLNFCLPCAIEHLI